MGKNWKEEREDSAAQAALPPGKLSGVIPSHAPHNTGCAEHSPASAISPLFGMIKVTPSRVSLNPALLPCVKSADLPANVINSMFKEGLGSTLYSSELGSPEKAGE